MNIFIIFITFHLENFIANVAIMMKMWGIATSNQGGRGLASFVGTIYCNTYIPQLKAQVSFSDHLCLLSVHLNFLSICKLFNILDLFSRTKGPILSKTSSMHPSVFKRVRIIGSCTFPRGNYSKRVK